MTDVEGVRTALLTFIDKMPLDATCALLLKTDELVMLHLALSTLQSWYEQSEMREVEMETFARVRQKVEHVLSQAGYGGDQR